MIDIKTIHLFVEKCIEANLFNCMADVKVNESGRWVWRPANPVKVRAELFLKIAYGDEINLTPIVSLTYVDIIKGFPGLSAKAKLNFSRAQPDCVYFDILNSTSESCTAETKRRRSDGTFSVTSLTFTIQMAKNRGLCGPKAPMWNKMPETMLKWRAVAALADQEYSGAWGGVYSFEELADFDDPKPVTSIEDDEVEFYDDMYQPGQDGEIGIGFDPVYAPNLAADAFIEVFAGVDEQTVRKAMETTEKFFGVDSLGDVPAKQLEVLTNKFSAKDDLIDAVNSFHENVFEKENKADAIEEFALATKGLNDIVYNDLVAQICALSNVEDITDLSIEEIRRYSFRLGVNSDDRQTVINEIMDENNSNGEEE